MCFLSFPSVLWFKEADSETSYSQFFVSPDSSHSKWNINTAWCVPWTHICVVQWVCDAMTHRGFVLPTVTGNVSLDPDKLLHCDIFVKINKLSSYWNVCHYHLSKFCFHFAVVFCFHLTLIPKRNSVFSFVKMLNHMMPQTWGSLAMLKQGFSIASQTVSTLVEQRNRCSYGVVLWNTGLCLSHVTSHCRTWIYSQSWCPSFFLLKVSLCTKMTSKHFSGIFHKDFILTDRPKTTWRDMKGDERTRP